MQEISRRFLLTSTAIAATVPEIAHADQNAQLAMLTDPFLQFPEHDTVRVVWFTEFEGSAHWVLLGKGVNEMSDASEVRGNIKRFRATTTKLSRVAEDAQSRIPDERKPEAGIALRDVWRHEAIVTNVPMGGKKQPYRVASFNGSAQVLSATFTLRGAWKKNDDAVIMLTSDHQAMINTPANMHFAKQTIEAELGEIAAVVFAGDLVNIPDRASEWFDDARGSAFFPTLQGRGGRLARDGVRYHGADIIQHTPVYPAIGNHEVQGRIDGHTSLNASFNNPVPVAIAQAEYEKVAASVNPTGDPQVKARWIENNSFSTRTYEEMFSLPGNQRWYAATIGNVRLVVLHSTRIWRGTKADPEPAERTENSRYQESKDVLDKPLEQGHGEFIFEDIGIGSQQYRWLEQELASKEFQGAEHTIVMLHEGPQGLGDNMMPQFAHPVRVEETDEAGKLIGIRYEYPAENNVALHELGALLEDAGVDLVYNGHSHLWNRFVSTDGRTNYLEASNTGNSYGAFHPLSGRARALPPEPWDATDYLAEGNPGGLEPVVPTISPLTNAEGEPLPFIADNRYVVSQALHTGTGKVTSWYVDMDNTEAGAIRFDEFQL